MNAEHIDMIEDCEARESQLTEWEVDFVASLRERLEAGYNLTMRQEEVFEQIWERVTTKGAQR